MKKKSIFLQLLTVAFLAGIVKAQDTDLKSIELDNKSKKSWKISSGFSGSENNVNPGFGIYKARQKDTALLLINSQYNEPVKTAPFFILEHEITNSNYREFINFVKDSLKRAALIEKGIPGFKTASGKINFDKEIDESDPEIRKALSVLYTNIKDNEFFNTSTFNQELLVYSSHEGKEIHIYPDTSCFARDHAYLAPWEKMYFWHPSYDNYPVVGISWEQAMAYCSYLTKTRGKQIMENLGLPKPPVFRLPTEDEWIYAAASEEHVEMKKQEKQDDSRKLFPWITNNSFLLSTQEDNENLSFPCNFGSVVDQNGVFFKYPAEDNAIGPFAFGSYTLINMMYDMAGNVAEWTMSQVQAPAFFINPYPGYNASNHPVYRNEKIDLSPFDKEKLVQEAAKLYHESEEQQKDLVNAVLHDLNILKDSPGLRIVKGGSWSDPPIYLMCRTREIRPENYQTSRVGFRVVMEAKIKHDGKTILLKD